MQNNQKRGMKHEKNIFARGVGVRCIGNFVERPHPLEYAVGRRGLSVWDQKNMPKKTRLVFFGTALCRDDHHSGVLHRDAGQSQICGLGLPGASGQCIGADLSDVFYIMVCTLLAFCAIL